MIAAELGRSASTISREIRRDRTLVWGSQPVSLQASR
ncbi:helix-turn-helix domain-containing protein [Streptomyces sp. NPDC056672]